MDSADLGRLISAYSRLAVFYTEIRSQHDFDISRYTHESVARFRSRVENPLEMAFAIICKESSRVVQNNDSLKGAYSELARAIVR